MKLSEWLGDCKALQSLDSPIDLLDQSTRVLLGSIGKDVPVIIRQVLENPSKMTSVARSSRLHKQGGFLKVRLLRMEDDATLRLHIWKEKGSSETPHSHRWDFASHVLSGSLEFTHFVKSQRGEPYNEMEYSFNQEDGYELKETQRVGLSTTFNGEFSVGSTYSQRHDIIHSVSPGTPLTATLVLCGPQRQPTNSLYTKDSPSEVRRSEASGVPEEELQSWLGRLEVALREE